MGLLSSIGKAFEGVVSFAFGWIKDALVPDIEEAEGGIKNTYASPDAKFPVIYGARGKVPGVIVFQETNDNDSDDIKNDLLHLIIVWSEGECGGVDNIYIEEDEISSDRFKSQKNGRWVEAVHFPNGMDGYYDATLAAAGWRSSDKLLGKCCSYIRCEYTKEEDVWGGFPTITADVRGRLISTPSGGAKTVSSNPVDQAYDLLKNPIYGKGLSTDYIDVAAFQAARLTPNIQVENTVGGGVYRDLFTSNIILSTTDTVLENFEKILSAMRAAAPIIEGKISLVIEKDDTPADFSLTERGDGSSCRIVELGSITNSNKANRFNRVIVKYTDPDSEWEVQEAIWPDTDSQLETDLLAEDNGVVLEQSVTLSGCTNYYEAKHRAKSLLEISREQLRTTITCEAEGEILVCGDIVPVTHSFPGWNGKLFRVEVASLDLDTGLVTLDVREHQPYIYDFQNTGLKPEIPDTDRVYTKPATPTNLAYTSVYDNFRQVSVTWSGTTTDYEIAIYNSADVRVISERISRKEFSISTLEIGTYSFEVRAVGGLGRMSEFAALDVPIINAPTPNSGVSIDNGNGVISVTPPTPTQLNAIYEGLYTTDSELDPNTDSVLLFKIIPSGRTLVVPTPAHGVTYYVWYRLKTTEGEGVWYVREIVSSGIIIDQLAPTLSAPIERVNVGGEIDIALAQLAFDIENIEVDGLDIGKAIDNKTLGTSVSVVNSQVDIIKQYMDGALTNAELFDTSESVAVAQQKISTLATTTEAQAALGSQLSVRTGEAEANITAQAERITLVEASADGNKSAVDALQLTVGDVDNPESVVRRLSKVESDSQGNAQAIDVVEAAVNDPDGGLAAAFVELQAVNDSISGIQATARFGVDVNGNFTGIIANGNTVSSNFTIQAPEFNLYDPVLGFNALEYTNNKLNFTGAISASEIYGSKLATTSGTGFRVEIEDDETYVAWAGEGPKNDTNADWYIKKKVNGVVEGFIKGEWLEGELLHEQSSTGTITTSVTHASKGKPVKLDIYIREGGQKTGDHEGVGFGVTVTIERNGTVIGTFDFNGTGRVYEPELNRTLIGVNGTAFMTDTRTVEESRTYTVTMTQYNSLNTVYNREVSIRTLENYVG